MWQQDGAKHVGCFWWRDDDQLHGFVGTLPSAPNEALAIMTNRTQHHPAQMSLKRCSKRAADVAEDSHVLINDEIFLSK